MKIKNFTKSIPRRDGSCSKDDRRGLYAPATGWMEMWISGHARLTELLSHQVSDGRIQHNLQEPTMTIWRKEMINSRKKGPGPGSGL